MLKKIICILSTLIILISVSILPVSAEESTEESTEETTTINNWNYDMWEKYYGEVDITTKNFDFIREIVGYDYNFLCIDTSASQSSNYYLTSYYFNGSGLSYYLKDNYGFIVSDTEFTCNSICFNNKIVNSNLNPSYNTSLYEGYLSSLGMYYSDAINLVNNYYIWLVSDFDIYNSFVEAFPNFADQIYYCENPTKSFLNYIDGKNVDLNPIIPPDGFDKTAIKYSNYGDCPFSKYQIEPYEVETENYVTAGLFSDLNIYYDSYFDFGSSYDHCETIDFYVDVSDVFVEHFGDTLFDYYNYGWDLPDLTDFLNEHFRSVHYENDVFSILDFFNTAYGASYSSVNDFFSIAHIGGYYYLKFTLNSEYSITHTGIGTEVGSSNLTNNGTIFLGKRVTHTCSHIDPDSGEIGGSGDGLGSDISQADDTMSRPPTKDELDDLGFEHGYPNTSGNYPYKITIYRNGVEYFQLFFNTMPSVVSTYYTDKCIDYGVNVYNTKMYMYFKEQNMSKSFDFTSQNNFDELVESGSFYDEIIFTPISEETEKILNTILNIDTSEFNNTYTLHMWTNYTGEFDNMNGFYCKFNWDLETSGHFQKNNSDDDYDYSQDYDPDESFTDNNGNIHGGAVETPTEESTYNGFNNEDFSFDENNLWGYANSFLNFCAKAFLVLPSFVWQLIACSIVVVIILRVLGR